MKYKTLSVLMAGLPLLLSACAVQRINDTSKDVDSSMENASAMLHKQGMDAPPVVWNDTQWVNKTPISTSVSTSEPLPPCTLSLAMAGNVSLNRIGQQITRICGIPVSINLSSASVTGSGITQQLTGAIPPPSENGMVPLNAIAGQGNAAPVATTPAGMNGLRWQGELKGLVDMLDSRMDISSRFRNGRLAFFDTETRTFQIALIDSSNGTESKMNSGTSSTLGDNGGQSSNSVSGDNSTSQTATMNTKYNLYGDIKDAVATMMSPKGRFYLSPSSGTLTVTDNPGVQEQIGRYIDEQNAKLNKQVLLNVQVLSLEQNRSDEIGLDWNVIYKSMVGANLSGSSQSSDSAISAGVNILDGNFTGSTMFLKALSTQGKVKIVTTQMSATTNLVPVPVQIVKSTGYLAQNSSTDTANVGTQNTMTAASITTGFNMTLLPYIMPDDTHIQLQIAMNLSDPPTIRQFKDKDGVTQLEAPTDVKSKSMNQRINLRTGQTLVMSGTTQNDDKTDNQGTLSPSNILFGGGISGHNNHSLLVVLVTPVLINN
ncbi:PilN family type IVB pilus formation outer membrane protein [Lelliottia aquatilis]|uniref:PilN family type IVB pilus formation outer membrane protein n=1 Tax=Lelliottia aquatilis TaxID=2080838 RepID=UPI001576BC6C|nr:PilN family type IVB pilus formation outer membrane protein [Lelliottia aquatilis]NTZ47726.1 PilN family type IVB pilus formation outer membrane protein [Lelliottia aquatilis]